MADFWGALGIVISVGLFLLGYRQTVGAKKERVAAPNQEVEKILVRRVVLEGYAPAASSVARLLEGKARGFRVRPTDLLSEQQVLNSIFTRVIESDFLSQEKREEIVGHLLPVVLQAEEEPAGEGTAATSTQPRSTLLSRTAALGLMGAAASLIGALVAAFPKIVNLDTAYPKLVPANHPGDKGMGSANAAARGGGGCGRTTPSHDPRRSIGGGHRYADQSRHLAGGSRGGHPDDDAPRSEELPGAQRKSLNHVGASDCG
jgi:hypothetical protein